MDHGLDTESNTGAPAGAYERPRLTVIGPVETLTLGPNRANLGDGASMSGPRTS